MPGSVFAKLPYAFPDANVASWKQIQAHVSQLSGFEPQIYHCCINSCCCFVGPYAELSSCSYCNESRYDSDGKPRQIFTYLPVIPRLQAAFANRDMAAKMRYRAHEYQHDPDIVKDVFDSSHYRSLLLKHVTVNGRILSHTFFNDSRDVALGISTDGFAPFRKRKKTCWPLILFDYNLPPEIRFHIQYILSLGIIPGPKKPVDFDSFLWPAIQEFIRLEIGIHTYDILSDEFFAMRAYVILVFGDIPAISMVLRMKGHNGLFPCRMCKIRAVPIPGGNTHYVPLDRSCCPSQLPDMPSVYDPLNLPLRTHEGFLQDAHRVQSAPTNAASEDLAKLCGIKGVAALTVLSSLSFPASFPYDFMHLIYENLLKNLMLLWSGNYKDIGNGSETYVFQQTVWEAIGAATAQSGSSIPSAFGPRPPNVATDKVSWTADTRAFWALSIGPVVLRECFLRPKYYAHFVELIRLLNICLQFEIDRSDISVLREGLATWVKDYERCVVFMHRQVYILYISIHLLVSTISTILNVSQPVHSLFMPYSISLIASLQLVQFGPHGHF